MSIVCHCELCACVCAEIWRFGFIDGLVIDERMKNFWGKISRSGGAGSNPEMQAVKCYVRMIALLKEKMKVRDEVRMKEAFLHFVSSPKFEFHRPLVQSNTQAHAQYVGILKGMFAGNFGSELARASTVFRSFVAISPSDVSSLPFSKLQFFEKLQLYGESAQKYFRTYIGDVKNAKKTLRNVASTPRCGSTVIVSGLAGGGDSVIRIQVCVGLVFMFVCAESLIPRRPFLHSKSAPLITARVN